MASGFDIVQPLISICSPFECNKRYLLSCCVFCLHLVWITNGESPMGQGGDDVHRHGEPRGRVKKETEAMWWGVGAAGWQHDLFYKQEQFSAVSTGN